VLFRSVDIEKLKGSTCNVIDTGTVQAFNDKEELTVNLSFVWDWKELLSSDSGKGNITMKSKATKFMQNYLNSPSTEVTIDWQKLEINFDKKPDNNIVSWCNKLLSAKLGPEIVLCINKKIKPINNQIIESYGKIDITMGDKEEKVVASNVVYNPRGGLREENHYIVLNFRTTFSNSNHTYTVTSGLNVSFDRKNKYFDYKVCYNSKFFGGFIAFRSLFKGENEVFLNKMNEDDFPTHIGFYKSLLHDIGNKYTDDKKVVIDFRGDKEVTYPSNSSFRVPTLCSFTVKGESTPFLVFKTEYEVKYRATNEDKKVKANLTEVKIVYFETTSIVDYQAQLIAMELANSLSDLIRGYVIGKAGLVVENLRSNDYIYVDTETNEEEICILYKVNVKFID
jgi:hypothetical protein